MPKTIKSDGGGKRHPLNMRTTQETRDRLEAAARANGRSLAQEVESRLERSFEREGLLAEALELAYGRELAGILLMVGDVMADAGRFAAFDIARKKRRPGERLSTFRNWPQSPDAFAAAADQAIRILQWAASIRAASPDSVTSSAVAATTDVLINLVEGKVEPSPQELERVETIRQMLGSILEEKQNG